MRFKLKKIPILGRDNLFKMINLRSILHVLGISLMFESAFMLVLLPLSVLYHEQGTFLPLLWSVLITAGTGAVLYFQAYKMVSRQLTLRDNFLITTLIWFVVPLFGVLPYILTGSIPHFADAYFETASGFSTTGSSILSDIEALPKSVLFWRALTHWIGGMGIIVLVIAILPLMKIGGSHLMQTEGSFFGVDKIKPRLIDVAKQLWIIYVGLTLLEIICLMIAGMDWFDASCHSFATIATGGFSTKNSSAILMSPAIQYILTFFMMISGINFSLHFFLIKGRFKPVFHDEEMRVYIGIILLVTLLLTVNTFHHFGAVEPAFRHAIFQIVSLLTATGFSSYNYELWPTFSQAVLYFSLFIGACVGSTGGGIKVARYVILFKQAKFLFRQLISPNAIKILRYNNRPVPTPIVQGVFAFVSIYFLTFIVGSLVMILCGLDLKSATSAAITTLGGIGPGFNVVGPVNNFSTINDFGKFYLSFNMILGRLEILAVLVIFSRAFRRI